MATGTISFEAEILKFGEKGEKTGWSYLEITAALAAQLKPNFRKSFRVKGSLDEVKIEGMALIPMGEGSFILALKAPLRKKLKKEEGDLVRVELEEDLDFKIEMPEDLALCLSEDPQWLERFFALAQSHRHYFIKWIDAAKTESTRAKRIALTQEAMEKNLSFSSMMRMDKARRREY